MHCGISVMKYVFVLLRQCSACFEIITSVVSIYSVCIPIITSIFQVTRYFLEECAIRNFLTCACFCFSNPLFSQFKRWSTSPALHVFGPPLLWIPMARLCFLCIYFSVKMCPFFNESSKTYALPIFLCVCLV